MACLYSPADFLTTATTSAPETAVDYVYEGRCPHSGQWLRLPRTAYVKAIARGLMAQLAATADLPPRGKMYGVLLVETPQGNTQVLKAFSGQWDGQREQAGWVPPIPGQELFALEEKRTLNVLNGINDELRELEKFQPPPAYHQLHGQWEQRLQELGRYLTEEKQKRRRQRQWALENLSDRPLAEALHQLDQASYNDSTAKRNLRHQRRQELAPYETEIQRVNARILHLKQQRKRHSRHLHRQMQAAYSLTNFAGQSLSLEDLIQKKGLPTGTGECCAPKLLHYAASHQLKPLAMAEFWWGNQLGGQDKVQGEFYGACGDRCQPIMGFLLSGLPQNPALTPALAPEKIIDFPIVYEDPWIIVVNKPADLLSVPGRYLHNQDSVLSRLRLHFPEGDRLHASHRLDYETSGVLLIARDSQTQSRLQRQFRQRQVQKTYEALLGGSVRSLRGTIELPLWGDRHKRPYQEVNWAKGKPSITTYEVIDQGPDTTRIRFQPVTGRTHQLRVHAAHPRGLNAPILGDPLYGTEPTPPNIRLHLHAKELRLTHPHSEEPMIFRAATPF